MYPLLASFEQAGWIEAEEVDGKRIFRITAAGQFMQAYTPSAGTMYPLLASFEQAGWIEAEEVDGKRIFRITAAG
ncbi:hypothetical protein C7E12_22490, partial [Stenotrophomonas maltophilia]